MTPGVTVLICTYNGEKNLPETLRHLAIQNVSEDVPWEVIVINNASTDNTSSVANTEWAKYSVPKADFKILEQVIPGKNHAFRSGINAASYEYILTCDDDNWLNNNYIELAFRIMKSDESIGALGGLGIIEAEQPTSLKQEELKKLTVSGSQKWASTDHWVYGAGSLYRRSLIMGFIERGWEQITTGRKGKSLICGEDVEICFMIYLSGYKIIAIDDLIFKHFVPLKRQNIRYMTNMAFWLNYSVVLLNGYISLIHYDHRPVEKILDNWFWNTSKTLFKQLISNFYSYVSTFNKATSSQKVEIQSNLGALYSIIENRKKIIEHHRHIKQMLLDKSTYNFPAKGKC